MFQNILVSDFNELLFLSSASFSIWVNPKTLILCGIFFLSERLNNFDRFKKIFLGEFLLNEISLSLGFRLNEVIDSIWDEIA